MSKGVPGKRAIAGLAALLALAIAAPTSSAGLDGPNGRASQTQLNGPNGRASQVELGEGPGGRVALTDWTLRRDPEDVGQLRGWPTGDFGGTSVSVPDVVNPAPIKGKRAIPDFEGSVAWYRTTLTAPTAGIYALEFASANYLVEVWVDGHPLGSHVGFYLPFEFRDALGAGTHTLVVRVDWHDPLLQTDEGFNRAWFNFGGLDGAVGMRELTASELSDPTIQTTLTPDAPHRDPGDRAAGRRRTQQRAGAHARARRHAQPPRADDPRDLHPAARRRRTDGDDDRHRHGAHAGAVGAREPQPLRTDARHPGREQLRSARRPAPAHVERGQDVPQRAAA